MQTTTLINYKELRKIDPATARQAVIEFLQASNNITYTARAFNINRTVVYDIIAKYRQGNLKDRPKTPHHQPKKTLPQIEAKVVEIKIKTRLGPKRLSRYLSRYESINVPAGTIRHILRRHQEEINTALKSKKSKIKEKRESVDWYSAKPFEIIQV
ncbi:MAG: helix-turn-helix domain-containing protein, partial [candidate division WOR-3 bacterium]|nr:helix-turn-helix domain-containing protein [candidate division WOR-3 bacterium]